MPPKTSGPTPVQRYTGLYAPTPRLSPPRVDPGSTHRRSFTHTRDTWDDTSRMRRAVTAELSDATALVGPFDAANRATFVVAGSGPTRLRQT